MSATQSGTRPVTTVTALFDTFEEGYAAVEDLVSNGFSRSDISFIARDPRDRSHPDQEGETGVEAVGDTLSGAAAGAAIGGSLAALASLPAFVIPVIGPIIAFGALATGLSIGGGVGSVIGALNATGVPENSAQRIVECVRCGGAFVIVKALDERDAETAEMIMARFNARSAAESPADGHSRR
jgi:hypothetical protein